MIHGPGWPGSRRMAMLVSTRFSVSSDVGAHVIAAREAFGERRLAAAIEGEDVCFASQPMAHPAV